MPTPQINVVISFNATNTVAYTYTQPRGQSYTNSPSCDLAITQATNCLFVLDYASTLAGWTITGISPNPAGAEVLPSTLGPAGLSLMTNDPFNEAGHVFNYYINYTNTVTGMNTSQDPQEGNQPP